MMTATAILRKEHEAILHMLDATEEVARGFDRGERVPPETLTGLLEFFRLFADRCHHGKEEDLLFPILEKKGMPRDGGPIGVMLAEHEMGRSLVRKMEESAETYGAGAAEAGPCWARAARAYAALLRAHIQKENDVLFIMAESLLTETEQAVLAQGFERVEQEKMGAGTHERLHRLMDKLSAEVFHGSR